MHFFPPKKMGENVCASYGANMERPAWYSRRRRVRIPGQPLGSSVQKNPLTRPTSIGCLLSLALASSVWGPGCDSLWLHSRVTTAHARVALRFLNGPVALWDLSRVPQDYEEGGGRTTLRKWERSLVIPCTVSAVSGHLLYYVRSLWSSPVLCPQSLVISCTMPAVSGHLLYYVRSLWSSPVLCP
ncbi:unnamed protein product [Staurois parvus]|uniref:Uncharacterized protein n=1 Tax=Staurois parvus TaxID=386267 RepID=A0ABN9C1N8_9NEOB|nr:unnamed protein product [Staurois parvus]